MKRCLILGILHRELVNMNKLTSTMSLSQFFSQKKKSLSQFWHATILSSTRFRDTYTNNEVFNLIESFFVSFFE